MSITKCMYVHSTYLFFVDMTLILITLFHEWKKKPTLTNKNNLILTELRAPLKFLKYNNDEQFDQ